MFIIFLVIVLIWFLYEMIKPNEDINNDLEFCKDVQIAKLIDENEELRKIILDQEKEINRLSKEDELKQRISKTITEIKEELEILKDIRKEYFYVDIDGVVEELNKYIQILEGTNK